MKVAFCQSTYKLDVKEAIHNVIYVSPYVDGCITVYDQTVESKYENKLADYSIMSEIVWDETESVVKARNQYLNLARQLGFDWIVSCDPDEHYDTHFLKDLRKIIEQAEKDGYNCLRINVRDLYSDSEDGMYPDISDRLESSDFWKVLLFKCKSDIWIDGAGATRNRHEVPRGNMKLGTIPKKYFYVHQRPHSLVLERAFRNIFVAGGGDGFGRSNPLFVELKDITDSLNINLWYEL